MRAHLILGNQLLENHPALDYDKTEPIIMIESKVLSKKYNYHKLKLVFIFTAMRDYRDELKKKGRKVIYVELSNNSLISELENIIKTNKITELTYMLPCDRAPRKKLSDLIKSLDIKVKEHKNNLHITDEITFKSWFDSVKKPIMENFYRNQRVKFNYLMDGNTPEGGEWNYDKENRKPLPKDFVSPPRPYAPKESKNLKEVINLVKTEFKNNPGEAENMWLPTSREEALKYYLDFLDNRLDLFGKYEDAIRIKEPLLYHSGISALLNIGLLEVKKVLDLAMERKDKVPLSSLEGFIRQILGWREYMYGLYWNMPDLVNSNYFNFNKELEQWWFNLDFKDNDLPSPIVNALSILETYGYNHHIERLMVLGNWFLLNEYNPKSVNDWFMSMYIDAYEWVMIPNVIGMSQYADGGKVATKPYISGDSYLKKMGGFNEPQNQNNSYTRKYWEFLQNNHEKLAKNPRMSLAVNQALKKKI